MSEHVGVPLEPITYGYCHCRCGVRTSIAKKTDPRWGHVHGQPMKFINGHSTRQNLAERFWAEVDRTTSPDGCHEWTGYLEDGYGRIKVNGRSIRTHRMAWILTHGPIPLSFLVVMHTCDNPPCCNPAHLELKDRHKNNEDRDKKGRQARGERIAQVRLKQEDADEIRRLHQAGGISERTLARIFSVSRGTVRKILSGETWRNVA